MNVIPFSSATFRRYQQIYSASEFTTGGDIDAISFRRNGGVSPFTTTGLNIEVSLAYAATTVATASPTFAENIGIGNVVVYSGPLTLTSSGSGTPNPFDFVIDVDNSFNYDPGIGDLLLDIRVLTQFTPSAARRRFYRQANNDQDHWGNRRNKG